MYVALEQERENIIKNMVVYEEELKSMLIKNAKSERDSAGVPLACKDIAYKFGMLAGPEKLKDVISTFNAHFPLLINEHIRSKL